MQQAVSSYKVDIYFRTNDFNLDHLKGQLMSIVVFLMHATWYLGPRGSLKWKSSECWQHLYWEDYSTSCGKTVPGTIWKGL